MDNPLPVATHPTTTRPVETQAYVRFDIFERIEHIIFMASFTILGLTGLVQKFSASPVSLFVMQTLGGIEGTRRIHHFAAFVMMWVTVYHIISVLYRVIVLRVQWTMMPLLDDFTHLFQDIAYFLGIRKHRAYYGRYNYAEKVEYLAVVWGTIIMGMSGFMMWNPVTTATYLPGQVIPAAKAAHGGEAILAVLAIIIWHMYFVHLKRFNKSMFTGKITREEMKEEHPAELETIEAGAGWQKPPSELIRRRQLTFIPVALVMALVLSWGVIRFVTIEPNTAISTVPKGETVAVFVPVTPTPRPTTTPRPTAEVIAGASSDSWDGNYSALFSNRCGTCHGRTAVSGLNLSTYQNALKGGSRGPAIVPGNPDASVLVQVQSAGGHPGQLTIDELNQVIQWILAGAPEQ
jgi:cytochrome b subunit of formate dehydrogenase/mono/diheme cytochrome c family protein